MKTSSLSILSLLLPSISGHAIFQRVSVNGADQGLLTGVRAPSTNNPVQNVQSNDIICNTGLRSPVSSTVITIPAGAQVGAQYQHVIGGPQGSNDADNPIAASHKGPIIVYLAKVSNAGTASYTGLSWFKIAQEGYNTGTGKWAVDTMISGNGWWYFTMPSCIAPGQYLMRVELIALHSAYTQGQAQFYMSCANIEVTGSGSFSPSSTVLFPGAYSATNAGILLNIYGTGGVPNNNNQPYPIPGPSVITCGSNPPPTTTASRTTTLVTTTSARTTTTTAGGSSGGGAPLYGQCGGNGWTGPTTCAQGTCKANGEWYSQCVP